MNSGQFIFPTALQKKPSDTQKCTIILSLCNCKSNLQGAMTSFRLSNHTCHRLTRPFPGGGVILSGISIRAD